MYMVKHMKKSRKQKGGKKSYNKTSKLVTSTSLPNLKGKTEKGKKEYTYKPRVKTNKPSNHPIIQATMIRGIIRVPEYVKPPPPIDKLDITEFKYPELLNDSKSSKPAKPANPSKPANPPSNENRVFFCEIPTIKHQTHHGQKGGGCPPITDMSLEQVKQQLIRNTSGLSCDVANFSTTCRTEITNGTDSITIFSLGQGSFNAVFKNEIFGDCTQDKHILRISIASYLPEQFYSKLNELANEIYYGLIAAKAGIGPKIYKFGIMADSKDSNKVYLYSLIERIDGCDIHSLVDKTTVLPIPNTNVGSLDSVDFKTPQSQSFSSDEYTTPYSNSTYSSSELPSQSIRSTDTVELLKQLQYAVEPYIFHSNSPRKHKSPRTPKSSNTSKSSRTTRKSDTTNSSVESYCSSDTYPQDFESVFQQIINQSIVQLMKAGTECGFLMMDSKSPNMLTTNDGKTVYVIDYDAKFMLRSDDIETKHMYGKINVILFLSFVYYVSILYKSPHLYPKGAPNTLGKFVLAKLKEHYYESADFEKVRDFMQDLYFENVMFHTVVHHYKYTELELLKIRYFTKYFLTLNEIQKIQKNQLTVFRDGSLQYPIFVVKDTSDPNKSKCVYSSSDGSIKLDEVPTNNCMWVYTIHRLCVGTSTQCVTFEREKQPEYIDYVDSVLIPEYKLFLYHYFKHVVTDITIQPIFNEILNNSESIEQKLPGIETCLGTSYDNLKLTVNGGVDPFRTKLLNDFEHTVNDHEHEVKLFSDMVFLSKYYGLLDNTDTTFDIDYSKLHEEQNRIFSHLNTKPNFQNLLKKYHNETQPTSVFL